MKEVIDPIDATVKRKPTTFSATISAPMYLYVDEITEDDIDDYTFEKRTISGNFTEVAKAVNIDLFTAANDGDEKTIVYMLGDGTPGDTCYVVMPRCTVQFPTMEVAEPLITRSVEITALDTDVEDSLQIVFT